jgi:putative Mg2+ transporter-C (MgtC) family protein
MTLEQITIRLVLALLAGGIVGIERERHDRPAGLRTHILVCLGSTLITLISIDMAGESADRTRIAAQIVTGIGFLGAGTIFRAEGGVRGLTTAAGLWVVAGIGMGIGAGGATLVAGLMTSLIVFGLNRWIRIWEDRLPRRSSQQVVVSFQRGVDVLPEIFQGFHDRQVKVECVSWLSQDADRGARVQLRLVRPASAPPEDQGDVTRWLTALAGVSQVEWS